MRCHIYKNLMFVLFILAVFNVSFLTYTMLTTNITSTQERTIEGASVLDSGNWRTRVPLFGKSVESILDQLSHGPQTPVFLYKPVCKSGSCIRYSGLELKKIFRENGFNIVEKNDKDWTVSLTNGVSGLPKLTKVWQHTNIIPGISNVCLRERLCLLLEKFSHLDDFKAFPKCFIINANTTFKKNDLPKGLWLLRKAGSVRGSGEGLTILNRENILSLIKHGLGTQLSKTASDSKTLYKTRAQTSIEQYIDEPFLVNKRKHLLRFYLLVKSINPLRVYMSEFGDVAFSQLPYSSDPASRNKSCMHLDIYTAPWCAKNLDSSSKAWEVNAPESLVWTLKYYWSVLSHKNIDVSHIAADVRDALLQTAILMAATSADILDKNYNQESPKYLALKRNGFVIFHVKLLLDGERKPQVIDVDCDPGLQTLGSETFRARQIKTLIQDVIKLSGSFRGRYDRKSYKEKLTDNLLSFCSNRGGCSEEEISKIITFEDERHNLGGFRLLYPHPNTVNNHKKTIKETNLDSVLPEYIDQIRKF